VVSFWRRAYDLGARAALAISFAISLDNPDPQDKHHYEQMARTRRTEPEIKN
jgi:hypothetical protein